ncbi:hypothetical protein FVA81_04160 [Rhizobium sp. WL3]|uniref:hypothetical protein n=1 Tax=Rhizobium sp. WL3 TaxID=2603277 RepID=UPI0011C1FA70|nr:hypothetical protein [Rhizobium sp. WL3]QEE43853.1 hypothetical protein FVA81_04160 [Rhizobium sp. WL3]
MRELWDRFGPGFMIFVVAIGFLRVVWGRETFCGPETEQCFREWVSALGGWAAVAAAVPTVYYLSKQISDARDHHRYSTWAARRPLLALGAATIARTESITGLFLSYEEQLAHLREIKAEPKEVFELLDFAYIHLKSALEGDLFTRFEIEIGPPVGSDVRFLLDTLRGMKKILDERQGLSDATHKDVTFCLEGWHDIVMKYVSSYIAEIKRIERAFTEETASIRRQTSRLL